MKILKYVELKSGYNDDGPAWIGYVNPSKSGRTLYFNGRALRKLKGQKRDSYGGNYNDEKTAESFWLTGVKKNLQDRHTCGKGRILVEAAALAEYLEAVGRPALDPSIHVLTTAIVQTDIEETHRRANTSYRALIEDRPSGEHPGPKHSES